MHINCVVEITLENYFLCLILDVKKSIFKKCKPKLATSHPHDGKSQPTTAHTKSWSRRGKKSPPLLHCHHHPHKIHHHPHKTHQNTTTHTTTTTTKLEIKENENQTQNPVRGLVRVWEKKWDEREKTLDQWHAVSNPALVSWRERERRQIGEWWRRDQEETIWPRGRRRRDREEMIWPRGWRWYIERKMRRSRGWWQ